MIFYNWSFLTELDGVFAKIEQIKPLLGISSFYCKFLKDFALLMMIIVKYPNA